MSRTVHHTPLARRSAAASGSHRSGNSDGPFGADQGTPPCGVPHLHYAHECPANDANPAAPRGESAAVTWNAVWALRYSAAELAVSGRRPIPERRRHSFAIYSADRVYRGDGVALRCTVIGRAARSTCRRRLREVSAEATVALGGAANDGVDVASVEDCDCVGRCWCFLDDLPVVEPYRPR